MANPPFNMKEWWNAKLEGDPRWIHGQPPQNNANFAWLQHMLYHLAPKGSMALLLANGSMSTSTSGEGEIRKALVEADLIECMNPDELAFYDALANNESAVREMGDDTLKMLASELTEKLRKSTTVDWQVRESVRAQLRLLVRRLLRRYKYPPDLEIAAIELVMKQAEALAENWTGD